MKIYWQSFVDGVVGASYLARLQDYLREIAAPGTEVTVFGMTPPDRDFGRLSEMRCAIQAVAAGIDAEDAGYDAFVMGHFQDPGLYELRSTLRIPVIGTGEATLLAASQLGRRIGLVTLDPAFEVWHLEQAERYGLGDRVKFCTGMGLTPQDFDVCFGGDSGKRRELLDGFTQIARPMVKQGADVIVPAGVLPGLLVGTEKGFNVDGAPVVNCAAVALKSAEMWVQLHQMSDLEPNRGAAFALAPQRAREDFRKLAAQGIPALAQNAPATPGTISHGVSTMPAKIVYSTEVTATGGREGTAKSADGNLDVALVMPKEFGGPGGDGTNPEQLFAAAWSACFLSATKLVARLNKITLPADPVITGRIDVHSGDDGYSLGAELKISIPGLEKSVVQEIVDGAHQRCPFSKATRGNVDVILTVV